MPVSPHSGCRKSTKKTTAQEPCIVTAKGSRQDRIVPGGVQCVRRGSTTCIFNYSVPRILAYHFLCLQTLHVHRFDCIFGNPRFPCAVPIHSWSYGVPHSSVICCRPFYPPHFKSTSRGRKQILETLVKSQKSIDKRYLQTLEAQFLLVFSEGRTPVPTTVVSLLEKKKTVVLILSCTVTTRLKG